MSPLWLLRMARWVRHPPGPGRVKLVFAVVALCLALAGIEALGLWPEGWSAAPRR